MRSRYRVRGRGRALVAVAVLMGALPVVAVEESPPAEGAVSEDLSPRADCCFANRAFTGVCVVKPEEDETCATILTYLNNPQSQGKAYCGKTTIRGGWQQTSCEAPRAGERAESPRR